MRRVTLAAIILALIVAAAQGQGVSVPQLINYQGRLTDMNGNPLATANYMLEFNVYAVKTGGTPIWGPLIFDNGTTTGHGARVPVVIGHFNVYLGPVDTGNRPIASALAAQPATFLGIKINGGAELVPRQQLLSSPYALQAQNAETLGTAMWRGAGATLGQIVNSIALSIGVGYQNSAAPVNGLIVQGNVGIGTNNPSTNKLQVNGKVRVEGQVESNEGGVLRYMVPRGTIVMWSGALASIPSGWQLCDGTNGTPNLRDRFVYGVNPGEDPGGTGGSASHAHWLDPPGFWDSWYDGSAGTWGIAEDRDVAVSHNHWNDPPGFWSDTKDHRPPYFRIAFIMKL